MIDFSKPQAEEHLPERYSESYTLYRHFKGGLYIVDDFAEDAGKDSRGKLVLYHSVSAPDKEWARPLSEWNDTVPGAGKPRFSPERLTDSVVEELWDLLEDVPFYDEFPDDLLLAQDWFVFYEFSPRESIWRWFDEHHSKGVGWLMNERRS